MAGVATTELANSSYLDWTSWRTTEATTTEEALGLSNVHVADTSITVAFVLGRASDPTGLLDSSWGERQAALASMDETTLWETYGADAGTYAAAVSDLESTYGATVLDADDNYVSSAASRTIWTTLSATQFAEIFGTDLLVGETSSGHSVVFWDGELSVPTSWNIEGLWFDERDGVVPTTASENLAGDAEVVLTPDTDLGTGNSATEVSHLTPSEIAKLYNFPELGEGAEYGTVALVEPKIGVTLDSSNTIDVDEFEARLAEYLKRIGVDGEPQVYTVGSNQTYSSSSDERSLDVGIVAAINPEAEIGIYAGSGSSSNFVATQQAIWVDSETGATPSVLSSSFRDDAYSAPDSPFLAAYSELYVDAALRNITVVTSVGDVGSGHATDNGLTNVANTKLSPYVVVVGGTSASTSSAAASDATLTGTDGIYTLATAGDLDTLKMLIAGGLKTLPWSLATDSILVETVWNQYSVDADGNPVGFTSNVTTSGGVDTSQATPSYQTDYGLALIADGPLGGSGRGVPDVSANAGGNLEYTVPTDDMSKLEYDGGTSASAPLWAALISRIDAVFTDQGLPELGYMNDLLYLAAAIAPAAFNDVQTGNNTSSYRISDSGEIIDTGYGYAAGEGYDLTTGLGTPNGLLLARALTQIAHAQIYYGDVPDLLVEEGSGWISGTDQTLLVQPALEGHASAYAWSMQFAQQAMQGDFSPDLVRLFDGYGLGVASDARVAAGQEVQFSIGGTAASASQGDLTSAFGFATFSNDAGSVEVARAVAVAELAGGVAHDVEVRIRQNGAADLAITFYRVDDYSGGVGGLHPGDAGYEEALAARAYHTTDGASQIAGPGYGDYRSQMLAGVDPGDLIAMRLTNVSTHEDYYGFSAANADGIGHLWNYGLNTWGWEDTRGGGDLDYNDLVVQLDFTSASGSGWLLEG